MSNLSLTASLRVCRVDSGEANRMQSDRFLNPQNMLCPIWDGSNLKGQQVCPDSFMTKSAGCNSANDRIVVENGLRPKYFDFITLNAGGLQGNIYGNIEAHTQSVGREKMLDGINDVTGNYGKQWGAYRQYNGKCAINAYDNAMSQMAQTNRALAGSAQMMKGAKNQRASQA